METLGSQLRATREKCKITLQQAAADTHISMRYLQILEEGRFAELPGGMYNRAFLRSYCDYLHLDVQEMLRKYEAESLPPKEKVIKPRTPLPQRSSRRIHSLVAWSVMLMFSVTGLYFSRHWISEVFSPYFSRPVPATLVQNPVPEPTHVETQKPTEISTASPEQPSEVRLTDQETPAIEPQGNLRLDFEVLQNCWISVNSDGTHVLSETLLPGSGQTFRAVDSFYIILGNAGGVRLKINGEPLRPLGKTGEVVRVLINEKNVKGLLAGTTGG
jgi:cytoskeleton protein RodZ